MPVQNDEPIYPLEDFWWRIPGAVLDVGGGVERVLTAADNPTVQYGVYQTNGTLIGSLAPMTLVSGVRGTWEAKVRSPGTAGTYQLRAKFTVAAGVGEVRDTFTVTA